MRKTAAGLIRALAYLVDHTQLTISLITRFEILRGLKARQATSQLAVFDSFCRNNEVLPITDSVIIRAADLYAELHLRGQLIPDADILIAATAIENGLVQANDGETVVTVYMENTDSVAKQRILTPGRKVQYHGDARIDGVPGSHAPIMIEFLEVAGSSCGALFPTGNFSDVVNGLTVTMVDNGMPVVMIAAADLGLQGDESIEALEANTALKQRVEALRLAVGPLMNLGDVKDKTVPKMTIVSAPTAGGILNTRSFIPHRVHDAVGVLAAASVATAANIPGAVGHEFANLPTGQRRVCEVEHPTGTMGVEVVLADDPDDKVPKSTSIMRTARLLFAGTVFYLAK